MNPRSPRPALVALTACAHCLLSACGRSEPPVDAEQKQEQEEDPTADTIARLASMLSGRFDSEEQAERDNGYVAVQLSACPISVPDLGRNVLYVEQALMSALDRPYRQRLYVLSAPTMTKAVSSVFEPADAAALVGLCGLAEEDRAAQAPDAAEVDELDGCDVQLAVAGDGFIGGTVDGACQTDFNGASYMNSEVEIAPMLLKTWDRGFDAQGQQVWGAVSGPYEFVRRE